MLLQIDSTSVTNIAASLPHGWGVYLVGIWQIYEIIVRLFPTAQNWSINGWLIKLYQTVIPNKNATTPTKPHP